MNKPKKHNISLDNLVNENIKNDNEQISLEYQIERQDGL